MDHFSIQAHNYPRLLSPLLILYLVQLATAKAQVLYLEKATVDEYALQSLDELRKALTTAFCFHW